MKSRESGDVAKEERAPTDPRGGLGGACERNCFLEKAVSSTAFVPFLLDIVVTGDWDLCRCVAQLRSAHHRRNVRVADQPHFRVYFHSGSRADSIGKTYLSHPKARNATRLGHDTNPLECILCTRD